MKKILIILALLILVTMPVFASTTALRDLPEQTNPGDIVRVEVTFTAPVDEFNSIGLQEQPPWEFTLLPDECSPVPDYSNTIYGMDYIWVGPFETGTVFIAVYEVMAPEELGVHEFSGYLAYYMGANPKPGELAHELVEVSGDMAIEVVEQVTQSQAQTAINEWLYGDGTMSDALKVINAWLY